jgi:Reverse transcriptase (RNA-dependent DNA polymerase)
VAGGHVTEPPSLQTYPSVVSRDSVRIAFLLASLNDLDIMCADIQGAYLNAPCHKRVHTICGDEFGRELKGRIAVIVKALYSLKTSSFAWRTHLAETLRDLGYSACIADYNVWMRPNTKPNGFKNYKYVLVYTDNILSISHDPLDVLMKLDQHYVLKKVSIGHLLSAQVSTYILDDDVTHKRWYMSSEKYVKEAIRNMKDWMIEQEMTFKTKASGVLPSGYRPELDVSELCNESEAKYYQQQIGVLRWAVELGRLDVTG